MMRKQDSSRLSKDGLSIIIIDLEEQENLKDVTEIAQTSGAQFFAH